MSQKKKQLRKTFREAVFTRDGYKCKICGETEELDAHHITDRNEFVNGGYVQENGITVCQDCHQKAEAFHKSKGITWVDGFHPDTLYELIGSSKEKAFAADDHGPSQKMWYIEKQGKAVPANFLEAALWRKTHNCTIASTKIVDFSTNEEIRVSTVFLTTPHYPYVNGEPSLYETMVFGGEYSENCERYRNARDARLGHERMVTLICKNLECAVEEPW